jgi:murein L,D-transpeptidase YcbB/YkuD
MCNLIASCVDAGSSALAEAKVPEKAVPDNTITKETAYSDLFLDSAAIENFIVNHDVNEKRAEGLRDFYVSRNYQYAWFNKAGLDEHGRVFWNLHNRYVNYSQDSSFFNRKLHQQMTVLLDEDLLPAREEITEVELALTEHFFDYAHYAYEGRVEAKDLKWHIPRKRIDAVALLDSLVATNGKSIDRWEPVNPQYKAMRQRLMQYYKLQKAGGWPEITGDKKAYREGDSALAIQRLKERLRAGGDLESEDNSPFFTPELTAAVIKAQKRFGTGQDGIAGPATLRELNVPVRKRIEQMSVNMERMRWMPVHGEGRRLVANIPEFKLHVYEGDKEVFDMRVVVGKAANKTVIFNDELKHIVFSPYWNIPASIVRNEILPAIQRNPGYLARKNMEQTGTRGGLPVVRQKPGAGNSLGKVKFLFPNSYAIYFHDTPAKSLFSRDTRAFSHGCIRLAEPKKLAMYLLKEKQEWTESRITEAMNRDAELWVNLDEPVPVLISYFTAWIDHDGLLNFRDDIYGHDKALAAKLFD